MGSRSVHLARPGRHLVKDGNHNGQLDGAGGAYALLGAEAIALAGVQILGVQGDDAGEAGDFGANPLIQVRLGRLTGLGSGSRGDGQREKGAGPGEQTEAGR